MSHRRLRRGLVAGGAVVALCSAATLAVASQRIVAEQAAFRAPAVGPCAPAVLNRSAVLPGTPLAANPLPDSYDASPYTQISLLGAPAGAIAHVSVEGSRSGSHPGRLRAYSQGDGASFVPASPFLPGETVAVHGRLRAGSRSASFAYRFVVAQPDTLTYAPTAHQTRDYNEMQHFQSRPDLLPPSLQVTASSQQAAAGDMFLAPYSGPGPSGLMILDGAGNLVWFDPLPAETAAANLQVQQLSGKPVLTWWQGHIPPQGFGQGEEVIADSSYRQIGRVHAGNGYHADLHDFHLTAQGTALLTVFDPIACNLSAVGGPRGGAVTDSAFQEVDLRTGLVRREWHSLDHVALSDSYSSPEGASKQWPYDFFHVNSVDQLADGRTLISARNTWALYELDSVGGQVLTRIGGRHSDLKLAAGAETAFQHDATLLPNGTISIFDNGAVPKVHPQSRGIIVAVDPRTRTDSVVAQYVHPSALSAGSQGNLQLLENGDLFVGWGSSPYISEFSPGGQLLFDAHMHGSYQSYRAYRFPWTGAPANPPAIAAGAASAGAPVTVYASWDGDTRTASWRVLGGPSPAQLAPVASAPRAGFETALTTPAPEAYVAVQALDASGGLLATSPTIRG